MCRVHLGGRQFGWVFLTVLLVVLAAYSQAQVTVGDNTEMNMSGNLGFGYSGLFADASPNTNQFSFGGNADLTGSYYNPNFLNFRVSPYYNQSRLNSDYQSIFSAKGVNASANLFSGSHTPVNVSFDKSYNNEGQFFIAGAPGIETRGRAQTFSIAGGAYYEGLPTLTASYGISNNSYDILGSQASGSGSGRVFNLGSGYSLLGFNLAANYTNSRNTQNLPLINDVSQNRDLNTHQNTVQLTVNRYLGWDSATVGANFNRTHFTNDYTGSTSDQTYDSLSSFLSLRPTEKLSLNLDMDYSTNYSAALLASVVLPPTSGPAPTPTQNNSGALTNQYSSDYLAYGARALYAITMEFTADGGAEHRTQNYFGTSYDSNNASGGLGYGHRLGGGQFSAHYGASWYSSNTQNQSAVGQSASVLYAHNLFGWHNSADFQLSHNAQTAFTSLTATGYSAGISTSRRFSKRWNLILGAHLSKINIDGLTNSNSMARNFNATLAANRLSFSGGYTRSSGNALQLGNGLTPAPVPGQVLLPGLLVNYGGTSYSLGAAYHPTQHFRIDSNYVRSKYNTGNIAATSDNIFYRFEVKSEYELRQLRIVGGYARVTQGIGATFNNPVTVNSIYVGVSRHFDLF